jgi:hypothetical protein
LKQTKVDNFPEVAFQKETFLLSTMCHLGGKWCCIKFWTPLILLFLWEKTFLALSLQEEHFFYTAIVLGETCCYNSFLENSAPNFQNRGDDYFTGVANQREMYFVYTIFKVPHLGKNCC